MYPLQREKQKYMGVRVVVAKFITHISLVLGTHKPTARNMEILLAFKYAGT